MKRKKVVFKDRVLRNAPIQLVHQTLEQRKVQQKIEQLLPTRQVSGKFLKYTNYDALAALLSFLLSGLKRFSQFKNLKNSFSSPFYQSEISYHSVKRKIHDLIDSPDVERKTVGEKRRCYNIYRSPRLNRAIIQITDYLELLPKNEPLIIDVDTTALNTRGKNSSVHYQKKMGYNPLLVSVNRIPVYYECRTGRVSPQTMLHKAVEIVTLRLRDLGYDVQGVRIDAAGYSKKNVSEFESLGLKFYIRSQITKDDQKRIILNKIVVDDKEMKVAERHKTFGSLFCRYVFNNNNPNKRLFGIVTNDFKADIPQVIKTYQDRGSSEQVIRDLKDFG